ncbi:MAG: SufE family protein [Gammaproteobacteria bacterium]|nr:SufE family protein [Gammaproteobacteria bacterium]
MSRLDDLVEVFELLGDWDQRYNYIMELGEKLPAMPAQLLVEKNHVKGCMSTVYVYAYRDTENPQQIQFYGYCDTSIIRGVLAILIQLVAGKSAKEIDQLDVDELFERLHLAEHLSPNRHVGIYAIVALMKQQAHELAASARDVA